MIAVIGAGYWGKNIIRNLYELGVLSAICETKDNPNLEPYRNRIAICANHKDILADPSIKAVAIVTPAVTHYGLAREFLLGGKDVFVEKPLATTESEGRELVELAEQNKRILMVGHILRYHPAAIKLKELVNNGSLGKIQYIYSNRLNIGKLRTEENILWSFAPHDISVILMVLGEEPIKVSAVGGDYLNKGIYDTTLTTLEFRNGVKGHIFVSWIHPFKEQKLVVVGSRAMAVFDDVSQEKLFLYPHKIEWKEGKIPVAEKADYQVVPVEAGEPLKLELSHFVECVLRRKTPLTDGYEGLTVLKVLELAERSLTAGGMPVGRQSLADTPYFVHQSACIDEGVQIGGGTKIYHFSHVLKGSKIGGNCTIGQNVMIGPDVEIGKKCKIQNNVSVYKGVTLEDNVFCGPSMVFTNVYNPRAEISRMGELRRTLIREGVTLGANCTIVCGITIGRYAFVGAGSVVTKDVPDYALVAGNVARQKGWMCACGVQIVFGRRKTTCKLCGRRYEKLGNEQIVETKEV